MPTLFRAAGATLLLLEVLVATGLPVHTLLPLGGSHIAQIAIILGMAFVINEFAEIWRS